MDLYIGPYMIGSGGRLRNNALRTKGGDPIWRSGRLSISPPEFRFGEAVPRRRQPC